MVRRQSGPRLGVIVIVLCVIGVALLSGGMLGKYVEAVLDMRLAARDGLSGSWMLLGILVVYAIVTAIPFVPGTEIGLTLLMVMGAEGASMVYAATVLALILAYSVGRLVPETVLAGAVGRLGYTRAAILMRKGRRPDLHQCPLLNARFIPTGWLSWLSRHPLVILALLINLPGNTLLGGGGGIAMATGLSRVVSFPQFVLCTMLAVAPVPLMFLMLG